MRERFLINVQLAEHLVVALEDLDGVPALLLLGHAVHRSLLDVRDGVLDAAGEGVHRDRLCVLCRVDGGLGRIHDAGALERRDLNDLAAELAGELRRVDLIAVLAHHVHHVDGDDNRDAELGELRGQVQVSLEVRAVDEVQNSVRTLTDQVVSRDDFLQRIGRKRIDARQILNNHILMPLQFSFFFFYCDPRPITRILICTGQTIK